MFATAYLNNALLCHGLDWIALAFTGELGSGGCILHMHVQLHVYNLHAIFYPMVSMKAQDMSCSTKV